VITAFLTETPVALVSCHPVTFAPPALSKSWIDFMPSLAVQRKALPPLPPTTTLELTRLALLSVAPGHRAVGAHISGAADGTSRQKAEADRPACGRPHKGLTGAIRKTIGAG
jgi:hypothetical protein